MIDPVHKRLVTDFYRALETFDVDLFWSIQSDDVAYNMSGHSPISGRMEGKENIARDIVPAVFGGLRMKDFHFSKKWKIVCADDERVVAIMEADGYATNGVRYDQRYLHMFGFRDGLICELWEFFDTALADRALFGPESGVTRSPLLTGFRF